jgi:Fe2+ or Zn2+ uptake regulation protein
VNFFSKKRPLCEVQVCSNFLTEEPAIIQVGEHEFQVCEDCARIMEIMHEKFEERLDDESI